MIMVYNKDTTDYGVRSDDYLPLVKGDLQVGKNHPRIIQVLNREGGFHGYKNRD